MRGSGASDNIATGAPDRRVPACGNNAADERVDSGCSGGDDKDDDDDEDCEDEEEEEEEEGDDD